MFHRDRERLTARRVGTTIDAMYRVSSRASDQSRWRRAAKFGLAAWAIVFASMLLASTVPGAPWQGLFVLYAVAGFIVWSLIARESLSKLAGGRLAAGWRPSALAAISGATVTIAWTAIASRVGFIDLVSAPQTRQTPALILLLTAAVPALVQAGVEEFFYRGVLLRAMSAWLGSGRALVAVSVVFAVAHLPFLLTTKGLAPPAGPRIAIRLAQLTLFGLIVGWTVIRTGTIWIALGLHFGSNYAFWVQTQFFVVHLRASPWLVGDFGVLTIVPVFMLGGVAIGVTR